MNSLFFCGGDIDGFIKMHYGAINRGSINTILLNEPDEKFGMDKTLIKFNFDCDEKIKPTDRIEFEEYRLMNVCDNTYILETSDFISSKILTNKFKVWQAI